MQPDPSTVARALTGDAAAFSALLSSWRGPLLRFVRHMLKDDAVADDVVQETFLTAHQKLAALRDHSQFKSWLFAIARSQVLMHQRRRVGEPKAYEPIETLTELGAQAGWGQPMDPETLTRRLEAHHGLEAALATLEPAEREVLMLRDVEGLSGDETAAALGLSLPGMKSRLHRARLRLVAAVKRGAR
jgi:RNA polymerase sigma-70 factor (ECF subfamily)